MWEISTGRSTRTRKCVARSATRRPPPVIRCTIASRTMPRTESTLKSLATAPVRKSDLCEVGICLWIFQFGNEPISCTHSNPELLHCCAELHSVQFRNCGLL